MRSLFSFGEGFLPLRHETWRNGSQYVVLVDHGIPRSQISHLRIFPNVLTVRAHDSPAEDLTALAVFFNKLTCDYGTRHQTFQIPLPRPGNCLVEVVDAEDEVAFGGSKDAEVGDVHVAAELNLKAGDWRRGKILRHDGCGAAQK